MGRPLEPEQVDRIVDLFRSGSSLSEIHRSTGIGLSAITRYVRKAGLDSDRSRRKRLTEDEVAQIIELRREGHTMSEIAQITGRSMNTVRLHLAASGLDSDQQKLTAAQIVQIVKLHDQGLNNKEIAEATGISRWAVSVQLRATGRDARRSDASLRKSGTRQEPPVEAPLRAAGRLSQAASGLLKPRPHQQKAITAAVDQLASGGRATVVAACGTGKTLIAARVAASVAANGRVLVTVPTLDLLTQTAKAWHLSGREGRHVAVCSAAEALRHHPHADRDTEITTDPTRVAAVLTSPGPAAVYCTYASLEVIQEAYRTHAIDPLDLLVVDEAHRTAGLLGKAWGAVHHDDQIPARRRLYQTATPRIWDNDEDPLVSMDDTAVFGPVVYQLDTGAAITAGLLADYRVVVPVVRDERLHGRLADPEEVSRARLTALQVTVLKAAREQGLRRILTFHQRVALARSFAETLPAAATRLPAAEQPPALWARWISGSHTPVQRQELLAGLVDGQHQPAVLANSRVLSEGVDVPVLDSVVFADPKASVVDTVQAVGRALRQHPDGNTHATILVPVFIGADQDPEATLESSAFAPLWRTLRALRAHDSRIAARIEDLRTLRRGLAGDSQENWLQVTSDISPKALATAIHLRTVGTRSAEWRAGYDSALRYHTSHGDLAAPQSYVDDHGVALGNWLSWQRFLHKTGSLPQGRRLLLDELGMVWEPRKSQWATSMGYARAWHAEHGTLTPELTDTIRGFPIGRWLRNLRVRADKGEVPADRIADLDALDPWWNPPWRLSWQRAYRLARAWHTEHGHLEIPRTYRAPDGTHLGEWLNTQRRKREQLLPQQVTMLNDLGIGWDARPPHDIAWERNLAAARAFHSREGHLRVPQSHVEQVDGETVYLGRWINNIRRRQHRIPAPRRAALDELGMLWP